MAQRCPLGREDLQEARRASEPSDCSQPVLLQSPFSPLSSPCSKKGGCISSAVGCTQKSKGRFKDQPKSKGKPPLPFSFIFSQARAVASENTSLFPRCFLRSPSSASAAPGRRSLGLLQVERWSPVERIHQVRDSGLNVSPNAVRMCFLACSVESSVFYLNFACGIYYGWIVDTFM